MTVCEAQGAHVDVPKRNRVHPGKGVGIWIDEPGAQVPATIVRFFHEDIASGRKDNGIHFGNGIGLILPIQAAGSTIAVVSKTLTGL